MMCVYIGRRRGFWGTALLVLILPCVAHATWAVPDRVVPVALGLAVILAAAKIGGDMAVRLGQVAVLGELLAGILIGNLPGDPLAWIRDDASIDVFARVGALVLLFDVGLELTVREVAAVGRVAALVAVLGTVGSLCCGTLVSVLLRPGAGTYSHVFVGAALTATSVGITARVLKDMQKTRAPEARVILGAAVIDDVLGLVILALVTGSISAAGAHGVMSIGAIAWTIAKVTMFFGVAFAVGSRTAPFVFQLAARLRTSGAQVALGLALCFLHAVVADAIGLAPIVGAFTAGLIVEDAHYASFVARGERSLRELVEPVSSFLVPVFFVLMGARMDLRALAGVHVLGLAAALALAAILGKLVCAGGVTGVRRLPVALGMIPRGEVTLIYASIGGSIAVAGQPVLDRPLYSALVLVVLVTTLCTPAALRWIFQRGDARAPTAASSAP